MLRIQCPCGTPYSLGDHLAGRTFKCPQCGRILKIGSPSGRQPSPSARQARPSARQAPPPSGTGDLAWNPQNVRSDAGLQPLEESELELDRAVLPRTGGGDLELRLADDDGDEGLMNSLETSGEREGDLEEEEDEEEDEAPRRGRSARRGRSSRVSGMGRASARNRRSGSARQRRTSTRRAAEDPDAHARPCPVCGETIARIARECPACGVVLQGPSALARIGGAVQWQKAGKAVVGLVAIGVIAWVVMNFKEANTRRPNVATATPSPAPSVEPSPSATPEPTPSPSPEPEPTPTPDPAAQDDPPEDEPPSDDAPEGPVDGPQPPGEAMIHVPEGPHRGLFERLRDARGLEEVEEAIAALAAAEGVGEALEEARQRSLDAIYGLRLHRASLRIGDERAAISASLEADGGLPLLYTAYRALEVDPQGLREPLLGLSFVGGSVLARAWVGAVLDGDLPGQDGLEAARRAFDGAEDDDEETRLLLAPVLVLGGDGAGLLAACDTLERHPSPLIQGAARKALERASAGSGPGPGASVGAWREWVQSYRPLRDLLAAACGDPGTTPEDFARVIAGRRNAVARGSEILAALPTFLLDRAVDAPHAGAALGVIVAAAAGPADARQLSAILERLDSSWASRGGADLVIGALLAADEAVAEAAVGAITRGAVPIEDLPRLPTLLDTPAGSVLKALREFTDSLSGGRQEHGILLRAAFRDPELAQWVLRNPERYREEVALRLGSKQVDEALLEVLVTKDRGQIEGFNDPSRALGRIGTDSIVSDLIKRLNSKDADVILQRSLLLPVRRLADASVIRKLASLLKDVTDYEFRRDLLHVMATLGGESSSSIIRKYDQDGEVLQGAARLLLVKIGASEGRPYAAKTIEQFLEQAKKPDQALSWAPRPNDIEDFVRCGRRGDSALLKDVFLALSRAQSLGTAYQELLVLSMGRLGLGASEADLLRPYVVAGHDIVGTASMALALAGREAPGVEDTRRHMESACAEAELRLRGDYCLFVSYALLDPEGARKHGPRFAEAVIKAPRLERVLAAAGCALAGDQESLAALSASPSADHRRLTAEGVAWAALLDAGDGVIDMAVPQVLGGFSVDPDPGVRAEAAVAKGFLNAPGAARELACALAQPADSLARPAAVPELAQLASLPVDVPLRLRLWRSFDVAVAGQAPDWREELGNGRIRQIEREMRAKSRR